MKKMLMVVVCTLLFAVAALATAKYLTVSGAGMSINTDQATADQNADSQAQTNLQTACTAGTLTSTQKIFDQCSQSGDNYVCNVNYTGICKIGN